MALCVYHMLGQEFYCVCVAALELASSVNIVILLESLHKPAISENGKEKTTFLLYSHRLSTFFLSRKPTLL